MARLKKGSLPSYRLYKRTGQGVVTIDGHDHYLGPFGSPSSKQKYAALIRAWQQRQEQPAAEPHAPLVPNERPTVNELILAYLKHARDYYRLNHGENKEAQCINDALTVLQEQAYGREPADAFRPKDLEKAQVAMIAKGWSRNYINSQVNRIKRMFKYAVRQDLVPGSVYEALRVVGGLRKGTPGVRETKKVQPVPSDHIKAVLDKAHAILKAMLLFAYRTGARPGEVCALKPCHLDRTGKVWVYHVPPDANKTEHHDQERKVYIGRRAKKILEPWLEGISEGVYVFSPARADRLRQKARRDARKTPLYPSHVCAKQQHALDTQIQRDSGSPGEAIPTALQLQPPGNTAALITPSTPIPLSKLGKYIPPGRNGKRRHASTIYRYVKRGARGVKLRCMKFPDGFYTTLAWWHDFVQGLTAAHCEAQATVPEPSPRAKDKAQSAVEKEIDAVRATLRKK